MILSMEETLISRVRGPDWWVGPPGSDLAAGFGLCPAKGKHAWFYGFRLALRTGLLDQVPRGWSIVPAAVDERAVGEDLVSEMPVAHLLTDRGFRSKGWPEVLRERGTTLLTTPDRKQRREWPEEQRRAAYTLYRFWRLSNPALQVAA